MAEDDQHQPMVVDEAAANRNEAVAQEGLEEEQGENQDMGQEAQVDDEEDDDEDGMEEEDDDDPPFEVVRNELAHNVPSRTQYKTPPLTDDDAIWLAASLMRNTHLKTLNIKMSQHMTRNSSLELALRRCYIDELTLSVEVDGMEAPFDTAGHLCEAAIEGTVTKLHLSFRLTQADALQIQGALLRPNTLKYLHIVAQYLNPTTAQILAEGIQGSQIHRLEVLGTNGDPCVDVMRLLYRKGMPNSKVRELSLADCIEDIPALVSTFSFLRSITLGFAFKEFAVLENVQAVVHAMKPLDQLEYFAFWNCDLEDKHVRLLTSELFPGSDDQGSDPRRLPPLLKPRRSGSTLELTLDCNTFGPTGAQSIVQATSVHSALTELDLSGTSTIGYDGLGWIGKELANRNSVDKPLMPL